MRSSILDHPSSRSAPLAAIFLNQLICFSRSPCARLVFRNLFLRVFPRFADRHHYLPTPLGHIAAGIQSRIAKNAIEQKSFISFRRRNAERSAVSKVHVHPSNARHLAWNLCPDPQGDALVGL